MRAIAALLNERSILTRVVVGGTNINRSLTVAVASGKLNKDHGADGWIRMSLIVWPGQKDPTPPTSHKSD